MRNFSSLNKEAQARVKEYIKAWPTIKSTELAEDLYLEKNSVAAIKAHLTRQRDKDFNEMLSQ